MLIVPFDKKIDWKNPPVITFLLIFLNVAVYLLFQFNDDEKYLDASSYYYQSGLYRIELPLYKQTLMDQGDIGFVVEWEEHLENEQSPWLFHMEINKSFMEALRGDQIITSENPLYKDWKSKRARMDEILDDIVSWSYSLKAGKPTLTTLFTHMFLHGSLSHLIGNMIFLLALGFIVELSIRRALYPICYLSCGLLSALFYIPSAGNSLIPSLGASGAIAGLMGMYTVLFNIRKIRFFYFIYVYFDYVKLPAITLLPLWLGFEIYQQLSYSQVSNVNYLAHIGGLISGALIAFLIVKLKPREINQDYLDENRNREIFDAALIKADNYVKNLQHEKAVPIFSRLSKQHPDNRRVLSKYYNSAKLEPGSDAHHDAALTILNLNEPDGATSHLIRDTFNEYLKTDKPRLTADLVNTLAGRFLRMGYSGEAEKLLTIMLKQHQKFTKLPHYLLNFVNYMIKEGRQDKADKYSNYLLEIYPESQESRLVQEHIRR